MTPRFRYRALAASLLVVGFSLPAQGGQQYWVCSGAQGNKTAQDHPCDAADPATGRREVRPAIRDLQNSGGSEAGAGYGAQGGRPTATGVRTTFSPLLIKIWAGFGAVALVLILLFGIKGSDARRWRHQRLDDGAVETSGSGAAAMSGRSWLWRLGIGPKVWSLALIRTLEWKRFEELCAGLWAAEGFRTECTGNGADGGIDVRLFDPADAAKPVGIIQCKSRASGPVGVTYVRELFGNIHQLGAKQGILATSAEFTSDAMIFAGGKPIELVDGRGLLKKLEALGLEQRSALLKEVTRGDYLTPSCPHCGIKMVRRRLAKGRFWGCRNFPKCEHTFAIQLERHEAPPER